MKRRNKLILEFTEFNLQRLNPDSVQASMHVDDPQLSTNAFDKHQDALRAAMSRVNDILHSLSSTSAYAALRGKLALEDQDIKSMKILRIVKENSINYDIYVSFVIGEEEYWGVIKNAASPDAELKSEVFKDYDLYQAKEWIIKIKGLVKKTVREWLKPEPGIYRLLNDEVICYSVETGKQLKMEKGIEVEVVRAYDNRIVIKAEEDTYNLVGDNYMYFNWWFEKIGESE
jgi:hypothetical protein